MIGTITMHGSICGIFIYPTSLRFTLTFFHSFFECLGFAVSIDMVLLLLHECYDDMQ